MNDVGRLLIYLVAFVAIAVILWWFLSVVALPYPLQIVVFAALAIIGIVVILKLARGQPLG